MAGLCTHAWSDVHGPDALSIALKDIPKRPKIAILPCRQRSTAGADVLDRSGSDELSKGRSPPAPPLVRGGIAANKDKGRTTGTTRRRLTLS